MTRRSDIVVIDARRIEPGDARVGELLQLEEAIVARVVGRPANEEDEAHARPARDAAPELARGIEQDELLGRRRRDAACVASARSPPEATRTRSAGRRAKTFCVSVGIDDASLEPPHGRSTTSVKCRQLAADRLVAIGPA